MSFDEIAALQKANDQARKDEWEKIRHICFYMVAPHSSEIKTPEDLYRFPWEKKKVIVSEKKLSKRAKKVEKWLRETSR